METKRKNDKLKPIVPGPGHLESPGQVAERLESVLRASMAKRPQMNLNARIRYLKNCQIRALEAVGDLKREYEGQKPDENLSLDEENFARAVRSLCNHKLDKISDRQLLDELREEVDFRSEEWPSFIIPTRLRARPGITSSLKIPEEWVLDHRNSQPPADDCQEG